MTTLPDLEPTDVEALERAGRHPEEIERQLAVLRGPAPSVRLDRPATVGDGILRLDDRGELEDVHREAAERGRVSAFVPASGAATRLFGALVAAWLQPGIPSAEVRRLLDELPRLALWRELVAHGARAGDPRSVLDAMFGEGGAELQRRPKALVPFHFGPDGVRTAFEEHLAETAALARDASGRVRLHFTVGAEHVEAFERARAEAVARLEPRLGVRFEVRFSVQDPATDTVAIDATGRPVRTRDGALLFRPGGHGALLRNLAAHEGDVVLVKNVDNVVPESLRSDVLPWRRRLGGLLVTMQQRAFELLDDLRRGRGVEAARAFVREALGLDLPAEAEVLRDRLDRPWRVCGMVRNQGDPGGGPFWAAGPDGVTLQIVESVQVASDPAQQAILRSATHFNPVDMALGVRDAQGRPYDLFRFTDPAAAIVTEKNHEGRKLRALEHPGLWNGGMARWNTVFVELPAAVFQPVKTLADLLRPGHGG